MGGRQAGGAQELFTGSGSLVLGVTIDYCNGLTLGMSWIWFVQWLGFSFGLRVLR